MPKELKVEAIKRTLGPHYWAEMHLAFSGNTPERAAWIAKLLEEQREYLRGMNELLREAEAELDAMQELADPPTDGELP